LTSRSGIAWNVDCMEATLGRLEERLQKAVECTGKRALVVGQSRGGTIGRALSVRRPDLVETLVTLGAPLGNQLGVHPQHWIPIGIVGLLGTVGVPGLFTLSCVRGECCARCRDELVAPFPNRVRFLAFYSRSDEVVRWQTCLDPQATTVEVSSSHIGMAMDVDVWGRLAAELA
jgi:triacylglycerol lipase